MEPQQEALDYDIFQRIPSHSRVNLKFRDVTYRGQTSKNILNGVSGEFRAGELTAIMGPSGCGKTTLLNLLSGYRIQKSSGHIDINDRPQNMNSFRKRSRYILQDDHISPYFTVGETMMFASNFKLDTRYTREQRQTVIDDILDIFLLRKQTNTKIGKLSGGERKRVCIALELMDNPAVLFLDEPTTGLDEFSAKECITILKRLANSGRTVICSIHCPSARLFQMFDKVYMLAQGQCIYQGPANCIVPYLQQFNLECPINYNPADFIIEVATHSYGNFHDDMVREINNGKIIDWRPESQCCPAENLKNGTVVYNFEMDWKSAKSTCSWWREYKWIFRRITQQIWRDKANIKLRITLQLLVAIVTGFTYLGIGNNAKFATSNYYCLIFIVIQFAYMCTLPMLCHIPLEMQYLRREYFNRWYSLSSYFMALVTSQIPVIAAMCLICSTIIYFLTDQPMELYRFLLFLGITFLTSMVASIYGLFIGSRFSLVNALFLGTNITTLWALFSNLGMGNPHPSLFQEISMKISFMRHAMEGLLAAVFQFNRSDMMCPASETFCMFLKPRLLLRLLGSADVDYIRAVLCLIGFYVLFMALAFANFKCRFCSSAVSIRNRQYRYLKRKLMEVLYFKRF